MFSQPFAWRGKLDLVFRFTRGCVLVGVFAVGIVGCAGAAPHPQATAPHPKAAEPHASVAVVTVCEAALEVTKPSPESIGFLKVDTLEKAESSAGSAFANDVKTWLAATYQGARIFAADSVVSDCYRIGGFPRS